MMIDDEELRVIYQSTGEERLKKLTAGLFHLEAHPEDLALWDELRREAHSLKGDARSVGIEPIAVLAQPIEAIIKRIQRQELELTPTLRDRLHQGLKAIDALIQEAVTDQPSNVDIELMASLLIEASETQSIVQPSIPTERVQDTSQDSSQELAEESLFDQFDVDLNDQSQEFDLDIFDEIFQESSENGWHETTEVPVASEIAPADSVAVLIEDEELRTIYRATSHERLHKLEVGLLRLAMSSAEDTVLPDLMRQIHSLKGDSRSVGLEDVFLLSQQMETILKHIDRQEIALNPVLSDRLFKSLVVIERLVHQAVTGEPSGVDAAQTLHQLKTATPALPKSPLPAQSQPSPTPTPSSFLLDEDEELREIYRATCEDRLRNIEAGLQLLIKRPSDGALLERLRRQMHSLKGDSRSVGLEIVATIAQHCEDIIKRLQRFEISFNHQISDPLHQGLHAVRKLVVEAVTGEVQGIDIDRTLNQLIAILAPSALSQAVSAAATVVPQFIPLIEDDELREIYRTTSDDRLQIMDLGLIHLEQHPDDLQIIDELLRQAHSLKGDSRSAGVDTVERLTHQIEEILGRIRNRAIAVTLEVLDSLYAGLTAIKQLVHEAVTGEPVQVDPAQVLEQLSALAPIIPAESVGSSGSEVLSSTISHASESLTVAVIEDEELRDLYQITSTERLQRLEAGLVQLEQRPDDVTVMAELLREAHSLKGDSRMAGVVAVERLIHQIEEILGGWQRREINPGAGVSDRLYQGLDAIQQIVQAAVTGSALTVNVSQVLHHLTELLPSSSPTPTLVQTPAASPSAPVAPDTRTANLGQSDTIRVQTRDLDSLIEQGEELAVTKIQIAQTTTQAKLIATLWQEWKVNRRREQAGNGATRDANPYEERLEQLIAELSRSSEDASAKLDRVAEELGDKIRTLRLLPLSTVFQGFPRMVRDIANQQNKAIELIIEGGETTADKQILEGIKDPLLHLLRNAIDHGIETSAEREASGKPAVAQIRLKGYQTANSIVIEVSDDGRGLNLEQIKQTAIKRKLYTAAELEQMSPNQIHNLVMASGFSTRTFITELSGRGVGLDVVRANVERLKGNIQIYSTPNQGCTFRLQISTALTTANVVLVDIQGIIHAIPFEFIQSTVMVALDQITTIDGHDCILLDDQPVPVANLIDVLELIHSPAYALANQLQPFRSERLSCVVLSVGDERAGFFVDRLLDTQEVVLKPQSRILSRVRNVMGATTLATGEVCMILNPPDLIKSLQKPTQSMVASAPDERSQQKPVILLVEDSLPVRTQEKRLFENAGYEVVVAVDGLDGYNKLRTRPFNAVVSDVEMPNLDGLSLTAKIRQHAEYDELPIILVTTLSSDEDRKRGADAGANAYIAKGKFNQEALLETLERLV